MTQEEKFEILDKIVDLKLAIKLAEVEKNWSERERLLKDLTDIREATHMHDDIQKKAKL